MVIGLTIYFIRYSRLRTVYKVYIIIGFIWEYRYLHQRHTLSVVDLNDNTAVDLLITLLYFISIVTTSGSPSISTPVIQISS